MGVKDEFHAGANHGVSKMVSHVDRLLFEIAARVDVALPGGLNWFRQPLTGDYSPISIDPQKPGESAPAV